MRKRFGGDRKYLYWGMTAFLVIAGGISLFMLIDNWANIKAMVNMVMGILSPFIWGFAIAYMLRPFLRFFESRVTAPLGDKLFPTSQRRAFGFGRSCAIILSELALLLIVIVLLRLVLPQLYSSIESIVTNSQDYYNSVIAWVTRVLDDYPDLEKTVVNLLSDASGSVLDWAKKSLLPQMTSLLTSVTSGVIYFVRGVYYIVIGLIVSVYLLFNKEAISAGGKKFLYSVFTVEASEKIMDGLRFTDRTFMDFISGKLLDSAIIGVLCYIGCLILGLPYAVLVAVIVGVTNIIPFFGPFIGAVPSALIIFFVSPTQALIFIIFVLLLQQFDGNILGPKIIGSSTGVNGFWIMFAIILGGGLYGFMGMLFGVPVFAVIYAGVKGMVNRKLQRSGLPTEPAAYENLHHFDPATGEAVQNPPELTPEERREAKNRARADAAAARSRKAERMKALMTYRQGKKTPGEKSERPKSGKK